MANKDKSMNATAAAKAAKEADTATTGTSASARGGAGLVQTSTPKFGEPGYVLKAGDPGFVSETSTPKFGEPGYVLKAGDPGFGDAGNGSGSEESSDVAGEEGDENAPADTPRPFNEDRTEEGGSPYKQPGETNLPNSLSGNR